MSGGLIKLSEFSGYPETDFFTEGNEGNEGEKQPKVIWNTSGFRPSFASVKRDYGA
jgi:hypothetical protein